MAADNSPWGAAAQQGMGTWSQAPTAGGPPTPSTPPGSTGGTSVPVPLDSLPNQAQALRPPYAPPPNVPGVVPPQGGPMGSFTPGLQRSQGWINNRMDPNWLAQHPNAMGGRQIPPDLLRQLQDYLRQAQANQSGPQRIMMGQPGPGKPSSSPFDNPNMMATPPNANTGTMGFAPPPPPPPSFGMAPGSTSNFNPVTGQYTNIPNPNIPMPTGVPPALQNQMNVPLSAPPIPGPLAPPPPPMGLPAQNPMAAQMNALLAQQLMPR
jgi:hypothetical protein